MLSLICLLSVSLIQKVSLFQWCWALHTTGIQYGRDKLAQLMRTSGLTWRTTDRTLDGVDGEGGCLIPWVRKTGDRTPNAHYSAMESLAWNNKLGFVLIATKPDVAAEEVLSELPSVEELIPAIMTLEAVSSMNGVTGCGGGMNAFCFLAAVCEKFGANDRALEYIDAALSTDLKRAGTHLPLSRLVASILRGRVLAALGRTADAGNALEAAAKEAHRLGVRFYEAQALMELKLLVLDPMGHGDHGSRRLGAVLRRLQSPAEMLTPLLKGLDAAELVALPPPEAGYTVAYGSGESEEAASSLRSELEAMRVMPLHKRALSEGVPAGVLEDVMDGDDPKGSLIDLIVEAVVASEPSAQADESEAVSLQSELQAMRFNALQQRAVAEGLSAEAVDAAMDSDNPKGSLVALIVERAAQPTSR
eukprot:COSAG04_NODE_320_length_16877_cov_26.485401_2_plen_419_part_00